MAQSSSPPAVTDRKGPAISSGEAPPSLVMPQQVTFPFLRRAHVCSLAVLTDVNGPATLAGAWPLVSPPQHLRAPSFCTAQVLDGPALAETKEPGTCAGA